MLARHPRGGVRTVLGESVGDRGLGGLGLGDRRARRLRVWDELRSTKHCLGIGVE